MVQQLWVSYAYLVHESFLHHSSKDEKRVPLVSEELALAPKLAAVAVKVE
jgi:hypothetical protein